MADPFHRLKHEHRVIERALRALDGIRLRLAWGERIPAEALLQLVNFIKEFANRYHHEKEESYLFPLLERQGIGRQGGPLGALAHEHEVERQLTQEMICAIGRLEEGAEATKQRFLEAALKYSDHLLRHMRQEDAILFRLADELLDKPERDALAASFRRAEAELGRDNIEKYERLATDLEETWAV